MGASAGCTKERSRPFRIRSEVPEGPRGFDAAVYQTTGARLVKGNTFELLNDEAVFDAMQAQIRAAKKSIHVVLFIWRPGKASNGILEPLLERAREGVACRVLVDPLGSKDFEEQVKPKLEAAGCRAHFFRPLPADENLARNHRKIVIADGRVGITGGWGVHDAWLSKENGGDGWRDTNVLVRGRAVEEMQRAFAENWQETTGELLPLSDFPCIADPSSCTSDGAEATFIASTANPEVTVAERVTQLMVQAAQKRLWIAQAYFTPNGPLRELLIARAKAGVDIRVLAPGDENDQPPITAIQRASYDELMPAGIKIWEFQDVMMHSKSMLVDDDVVLIGSINFDPLSFRLLEEGSLLVRDAAFAKVMEALFLKDLERARQVNAAGK